MDFIWRSTFMNYIKLTFDKANIRDMQQMNMALTKTEIFKRKKTMNHWLKLIGSSTKPITDHPFYGNYKKEFIGFRKAGKPGIRMGDHIFLYAPGGSKSIFALAEATDDPELDDIFNPEEEGSCQWQLSVRYLMNLPVANGIIIDEANSGRRKLTRSICRQSHIKLFPDEYKLAYDKLQKKTSN